MALNQAQQIELGQMLDSEVFKAAQAEVLKMSDGSVDSLLAPEAAIKMAIEKGVRNAFRLLRLAATSQGRAETLRSNTVSRTK